jgi:transcriptional regulator NrdR family protein
MTHPRIREKLACPSCGHLRSRILPHHPNADQQRSGGFWRKRECLKCGACFRTEETICLDPSRSSARPPSDASA